VRSGLGTLANGDRVSLLGEGEMGALLEAYKARRQEDRCSPLSLAPSPYLSPIPSLPTNRCQPHQPTPNPLPHSMLATIFLPLLALASTALALPAPNVEERAPLSLPRGFRETGKCRELTPCAPASVTACRLTVFLPPLLQSRTQA